jgi:hypothetical protein
MAAGTRALLAALALGAAHTLLAALMLVSGSPRMAAFFAACAVVTVAVLSLLGRLLSDAPPPRGGGSETGPPAGPDDRGPREGEPAWWPDFEDAFRAHVAAQDRVAHRVRPPVG